MKPKVVQAGEKKKQRMIRLPIIFILIVLGIYAYSFTQEYMRYIRLNSEVERHQAMLASVQQKYDGLLEDKALHFNEEFIERLARKNLGMIKEGETLIFPMKTKDVPLLNEDLNEDYDIH